MKRFFSYLGRFLYHLILVILNKHKENKDQDPCITDQEINLTIEGDEFSMELNITDSIKNRVAEKIGDKVLYSESNGAGKIKKVLTTKAGEKAPSNQEQTKEAEVNESNKQ